MKRKGFFGSARRAKKKDQDRTVFVLFLSGLFAALVIAVLAQQGGQSKKGVGESPSTPPEFATLLPEGSAGAENVELVDSTTPTYVAGYLKDGGVGLALIVWSKENGRYELRSLLMLDSGEDKLVGISSLAIERLGEGVPTLIQARGPKAASANGAVFAVRETDKLREAKKLDKDGYERPASFPVGTVGSRMEELEVSDIDDDGTREVVATSRNKGSETVSVYAWSNGRLEYDADLSWAMTMDKQLFPEPLSEAPLKN